MISGFPPLEQTMSQYLIERIRAQPNIEVVIGCEISELEGAGGVLRAVSWRDQGSVGSGAPRSAFTNDDWTSCIPALMQSSPG